MAIDSIGGSDQVDLHINSDNLYREETLTDLEGGAVRQMVPVTADGEQDPGRSRLYFGSVQVMTPQGPLPVQARLMANSLAEALDDFPGTMQKALDALLVELEKYKAESESRIITPGR